MTEEVIYRQETQDDFQEVFELNNKAFGQDNEAKLVNTLRDNPNVFIPELSIVAAEKNKIIGYILLTKITIKDKNGMVLKLPKNWVINQ
jgi:predicted N-acetyltransferase YhbS